jgi:hypothetical protein
MIHRKELEEIRDILTDTKVDFVAMRACTALERLDALIARFDKEIHIDPSDTLFVGYSPRGFERRMYSTPGMAESMNLVDVKEYVRVRKEDAPKEIAYAVNKNGNPL